MSIVPKDSTTQNTEPRTQRPVRLSKKERVLLGKISSVVASADDPQAAVAELEATLSAKYLRPLEALQRTMTGNLSSIRAYGLWQTLKHLVVYGDNSDNKVADLAYVQQYRVLEKAGGQLKQLTGYNWLTVGYFTLLTFILIVSITIYKVKVLPVYADMFQSFGAELPAFTQYILNGGFEVFALALLFFTILYSLILPFLFKRALGQLRKMPFYLVIFPAYLLCRTPYRQYCWQTYARIYHHLEETSALQKANQALWGSRSVSISGDDWVLLNVASHHGSLDTSLDELEKQLLITMQNRIAMADIFIRLMLLLAFAWVVSAPVIAMYLPIFQMGAIVN